MNWSTYLWNFFALFGMASLFTIWPFLGLTVFGRRWKAHRKPEVSETPEVRANWQCNRCQTTVPGELDPVERDGWQLCLPCADETTPPASVVREPPEHFPLVDIVEYAARIQARCNHDWHDHFRLDEVGTQASEQICSRCGMTRPVISTLETQITSLPAQIGEIDVSAGQQMRDYVALRRRRGEWPPQGEPMLPETRRLVQPGASIPGRRNVNLDGD